MNPGNAPPTVVNAAAFAIATNATLLPPAENPDPNLIVIVVVDEKLGLLLTHRDKAPPIPHGLVAASAAAAPAADDTGADRRRLELVRFKNDAFDVGCGEEASRCCCSCCRVLELAHRLLWQGRPPEMLIAAGTTNPLADVASARTMPAAIAFATSTTILVGWF